MLQSLVLQVDVRVIEGGYLDTVLQDLMHLKHLKLILLKNTTKAVSDNLLEFKTSK